jgi:hypothetical protein
MNRRPIVGSIVHYDIADHPCIASIVTQVHSDEVVALTPFYPPGSPIVAATAAKALFTVHHAETKREMYIRSWHWADHETEGKSPPFPERADAHPRSTPEYYRDGYEVLDGQLKVWRYCDVADVWHHVDPNTLQISSISACSYQRLIYHWGPITPKNE